MLNLHTKRQTKLRRGIDWFGSTYIIFEAKLPIARVGAPNCECGKMVSTDVAARSRLQRRTSVEFKAFLGLLLDCLIHGDQFSFWVLLFEFACTY